MFWTGSRMSFRWNPLLWTLRPKTQVLSNSNRMVLWLLEGFGLGVVWTISGMLGTF